MRPVDHAPAPAGKEILDVDDHVEVRAVPTAGEGLLVVEEEPADVDQGIGPSAGRALGTSVLSGMARRNAAATTEPPSASSAPSSTQRSSMVWDRCSERSGSDGCVCSGWLRASQ